MAINSDFGPVPGFPCDKLNHDRAVSRAILTLIYTRGASHRELAGVLGISRGALRRMLKDIIERMTDPKQLSILEAWDRLTPDERRLAYLHRILGLPLREIARQGLIRAARDNGASDGPVSPTRLRVRMRRIERKARWNQDRPAQV